MAGTKSSGRHSSIYILTTSDEYELPLIIGTKHEIAQFVGCPPINVPLYSKNGSVLNKAYRVFMYKEELAV